MLEQFQSHLERSFPFLINSRLLLAVSGGIDSMVLLHLLKQSNLDFEVAHCNFQLRDQESVDDEVFVQNLSQEEGLICHCKSFETEQYAEQNKLSTQMAARDLRYQWFDELLDDRDLDYILTAHHLDDNLETFLINVSRGTGIEGLKGIPSINGNRIRPLLIFSREQIVRYAKDNNLKWREDSSNQSDKYLRNHFRLNIISELKKANPDLLNNFQKTIMHITSASEILDSKIEEIKSEVITFDGNEVLMDIEKLRRYQPLKEILYQLLKGYGFTQWEDIYDLLSAQSGKQVLSKTWRLVKDRNHVIVSEIDIKNQNSIQVLDIGTSVATHLGTLAFEVTDSLVEQNSNSVIVDSDKIDFPLTIRTWQDGDRFSPFGMNGSKKVSKYLKDEKLSLIDKDKTLVLTSNDDIVWIIGKRLDNRFAVTDDTENLLKITLQ